MKKISGDELKKIQKKLTSKNIFTDILCIFLRIFT